MMIDAMSNGKSKIYNIKIRRKGEKIMKKKIVAIALFLIRVTFLIAFGGCEEETREHVTVLVYKSNESGVYICEMTEETNEKEITVEYSENGYYFCVAIKFPDESVVTRSSGSGSIIGFDCIDYTKPNGEKGKPSEHLYERGTYLLTFEIDREDCFPFLCFLTVHIV